MPPSSSKEVTSAGCPHVRFRAVLGERKVAGLLDHVHRRKDGFKLALVRDRNSGERRVDYERRCALSLGDLGSFKAPIESFVSGIAAQVVQRLELSETNLLVRDFEIAAFQDGGRFGAHIDTDERTNRVRVLSCVYYFAQTPARFSGGELRLYALPSLSADGSPGFVDIAAETDTMVVFPSWLRHEVLPVRVPSGAWMDGRFTVNCWLHRSPPGG